MRPKPRMPKLITLPFGYRVKVKYRSPAQMRKAGLANCYGAWLVSERSIYLDKSQHIGRQILTLIHELQHACVDLMHHADELIVQPLVNESAETMKDMEGEE
jgi:Zn-dependent peptidase ImmA (M78 family)